MKLRLAWIPVIAAACLALPSPAADKPPLESAWTATPIQIDGQLEEWPEAALQQNKDFEVRYAFKNDANFLYCVFVFDNPRYLSSLEQSGLTFWINPEKERRTYGFRFYQKQVSADQLIELMEKNGTTLTAQKKAELKLKPRYQIYACDVLDKKGNILPRQPGTANSTYRAARVQKRMILEYAIPLALLTDPNQKPALDPARPFHLGFEWGGMTEEMRKQMAADVGGDNVRANSRAADMSTGGEESGVLRDGGLAPSASLADGMRRMPKKYDFWIDLKLGVKQ
jgi:hypothetical protein